MATVRFTPEKERKLKAAMDWLQQMLEDGEAHVSGGLKIRGMEAGHSERTLQRAARLLGVKQTPVHTSQGKHSGVLWELPATSHRAP
jgi:hypothetical protein